MKKIANRPVVHVEWVDACTFAGWQRPEDIIDSGLSKMHTVGLLVYKDSKVIIISPSRGDSGRFGDALTIPRSTIKKIRYL